MFCNRCGTDTQAGGGVCPRCGRHIGDPVGEVAQSRLERHLHTLGILWMAIGGLFLIPAAGMMVFGRGLHFVLNHGEPWPEFFQLLVYVAGSTFADSGGRGNLRRTGANADGSLGADSRDYPGSAGAVSSAVRDRAGSVLAVGFAGG